MNKRRETMFVWRQRHDGDCIILAGALFDGGYSRIGGISGHRYAWERIHGPIPSGMVVRHLCNRRACVKIEHLALGTPKDNMDDRERAGQTVRGEKQHCSVLREDDVRAIRMLHSSEECSIRGLARFFGVNKTTIKKVITRQTWKHV